MVASGDRMPFMAWLFVDLYKGDWERHGKNHEKTQSQITRMNYNWIIIFHHFSNVENEKGEMMRNHFQNSGRSHPEIQWCIIVPPHHSMVWIGGQYPFCRHIRINFEKKRRGMRLFFPMVWLVKWDEANHPLKTFPATEFQSVCVWTICKDVKLLT